MSLLICKICEGNMHIVGEVSHIEPAVKCESCGFTNNKKQQHKNKSKKVIVEYR